MVVHDRKPRSYREALSVAEGLFDLGFDLFATRRMAPIVYGIVLIVITVYGLITLWGAFSLGGGIALVSVVMVPFACLVAAAFWRLALEAVLMLMHVADVLHGLDNVLHGLDKALAGANIWPTQPPAAPSQRPQPGSKGTTGAADHAPSGHSLGLRFEWEEVAEFLATAGGRATLKALMKASGKTSQEVRAAMGRFERAGLVHEEDSLSGVWHLA